MSHCYIFGSKLSNVTVIYLVFILAGAKAIRLIDEDDLLLDHDDPPHSYATNMWLRFANYTVKTSDMKGNYYLCVIVGDSCCT